MILHPIPNRRRAQRGVVARGILVVAGLAAAIGLQLEGSQLQARLGALFGVPQAAPVSAPACSGRSCASSMRTSKVAVAVAVAETAAGSHAPAF